MSDQLYNWDKTPVSLVIAKYSPDLKSNIKAISQVQSTQIIEYYNPNLWTIFELWYYVLLN